jgi:hypothetical protein
MEFIITAPIVIAGIDIQQVTETQIAQPVWEYACAATDGARRA